MGAFGDFLGGARRVFELLAEARALLRRAKDENDEAVRLLREAATGTADDRVASSLTCLGRVGEALDTAEGHGRGGAEAFGEYLTAIGAEAALADSSGGAADGEPKRVRLPDFNAMRERGLPQRFVFKGTGEGVKDD